MSRSLSMICGLLFSVVVFGAIFMGLGSAFGHVPPLPRIAHSIDFNDRYEGTFVSASGVEYRVKIHDSSASGRVVYLQPLAPEHEEPYSIFVMISAQDNDQNMVWDRVTYCGYQRRSDGTMTGCNSVNRSGNQEGSFWKWEPCQEDSEDGVQPLTAEEIDFARNELDQAIFRIFRSEYLVSRTVWDNIENKFIEVLPLRLYAGPVVLPAVR
ncbi:MAG: hypothetical protein AAB726_01220 [Patescibacteria group bacterium]